MITATEALELSVAKSELHLEQIDRAIRKHLAENKEACYNSIVVPSMYPLLQKRLEGFGYTVRLFHAPNMPYEGWIIIWQ